jgi:uncharacterized membrane protein
MDVIFKVLLLILLTFMPFIELRLSIPIGILSGTVPLFFCLSVTGMGFHPFLVFVLATLTNILLGFGIFDLLTRLDKRLHKSKANNSYVRLLDRSRAKLEPYVKRYGLFGIALFIALPIPGSGVYIGSIGSFVLGLSQSAFRKACIIGVLFAALIVTLLTITGQHIFGLF